MYRWILRSLLLFSLTAAGSVVAAQPTLSLAGTTVALDGASPGGTVAFFSVSRVPLGYSQQVEVLREVALADASGRAEWSVDHVPALKSVWAAVDLTSGDWALAVPTGGVVRQQPLDLGAFERGANGELSALRYAGHVVLEALLVRTELSAESQGVWGLRLSDGGETDGDGEHNDAIRLAPSSMEAIAETTPPPSAFAPGDVVILIDSDRLEVSALRLEEATTGQGGER